MPVPKQRHTKSRRNRGRSHHALKKRAVFYCPKCKAVILPHQVCANCGYYNGKEIIDVMAKLSKKEKKNKAKEIAEAEKTQKPMDMQELSKK